MCKVQFFTYSKVRGTLGVDMTWYMDFSFKTASDRDTRVNFDPYSINHSF